MNERTSKAAVSFLERIAFTNLQFKGSTLGRVLGDLSPSVLHRVARSNGVEVDDAGKLRCPDGEFTDVFGSNCVIPDGPDFTRIAKAAADFVNQPLPSAWKPGTVLPEERERYDMDLMGAEDNLEDILERAWNDLGDLTEGIDPPTRDEVVDELTHAIPSMVEAPTIRVTPEVLDKVLHEGRFKNFHESGTTKGGSQDTDRRDEERRIGIPFDSTQDNFRRPIYGYAHDEWVHGEMSETALDAYGNIEVGLKDGILDRTTFTVGDVYNGHNWGLPARRVKDEGLTPDEALAVITTTSGGKLDRRPGGFLDNFIANMIAERLEMWDDDGGRDLWTTYDYVEMHFHGGVSVADIDFVHFRNIEMDNWEKGQLEGLRKALDALGIRHNLPETLDNLND